MTWSSIIRCTRSSRLTLVRRLPVFLGVKTPKTLSSHEALPMLELEDKLYERSVLACDRFDELVRWMTDCLRNEEDELFLVSFQPFGSEAAESGVRFILLTSKSSVVASDVFQSPVLMVRPLVKSVEGHDKIRWFILLFGVLIMVGWFKSLALNRRLF